MPHFACVSLIISYVLHGESLIDNAFLLKLETDVSGPRANILLTMATSHNLHRRMIVLSFKFPLQLFLFYCVAVPPEIIEDMSSIDVTVQEGDTVTLTCNVTGVPLPHVTWQRKSVMNKAMSIKETKNCEHRTSGLGGYLETRNKQPLMHGGRPLGGITWPRPNLINQFQLLTYCITHNSCVKGRTQRTHTKLHIGSSKQCRPTQWWRERI